MNKFPAAAGLALAAALGADEATALTDDAAVAELARTLTRGGALLVIEPAFATLRRAHDDVVHGKRRYRTGALAAISRSVPNLRPRNTPET